MNKMDKKIIDFNKTVYELCNVDPSISEVLEEIGFKNITTPGMLATAGRFMTIPKGATMKRIDLEIIRQAFINLGYEIHE
jgi:hypothetical protein